MHTGSCYVTKLHPFGRYRTGVKPKRAAELQAASFSMSVALGRARAAQAKINMDKLQGASRARLPHR
jgi:hypothetical protein